ncbi:MAG: hypothetical protein R3B09_15240 [Nannocystaceae bacterium]
MIDAGLCATCVAGRSVVSGRGSVFWRCAVHDEDPRVPKYPRLPVRGCPYYRSREPTSTPPGE